ncbi:Re/Si-specific NAD(P)(+) transhydrogenase subunit alpha [Nitrospira defluvii]|uniref:Re/Si-specific NAD(P)(+) transhydrogenase subunit alpha n=1 Tax=Nitrospira defluvii TaxID=330214 RepID=UPI001BB48516|nr:Re/Si-specific NAD(P)(+) transhydrogenase subunit alpha [Nitrospira defluvii]
MTHTKQTVVGVPKETYPGETLVALTPAHVPLLTKIGLHVLVESGAGEAAGFEDEEYRIKGARVASDRSELFASAEILLQVRTLGANPDTGRHDLPLLRADHVLIGLADPLGRPEAATELAHLGVTVFAMELMPRIARAQSMDMLSSLATIVGYKAVLLAAASLSKLFPMLMTAAGTIPPARVLVIGAGVAGLQAIATARRLGAAVAAYDVRPAVKDQIQSLGAKVIDAPVEAGEVEELSGYAKTLGEHIYRKQRERLTPVVAASDVVIATAAVPGRPAPRLITADMVARMARGSVIMDVAAERGGNCELTRPNEVIVHHGVTVLGPTNLPNTVPMHASQMCGRNLANVLLYLCKDGFLHVDVADEITRETLVTRGGAVVHPRIGALPRATHYDVAEEGNA